MKPVEVIIACHNPKRAVGKAIASVVDGSSGHADVTVVAHNLGVEDLQAVVADTYRDKVKWLELRDGIKSPSGPFNYAIGRSHADWVSIMGSDDTLEPGAVAAWLRLAKGADAVVSRVRYANGRPMPTPPVRPFPMRYRDPVKDRLFYRSAPLGLMRREFLNQRHLRLAEGLSVGGDLQFTVRLWTEGRIRVQRRGPAYTVGEDAGDRVTLRGVPLDEELTHSELVWTEATLRGLTTAQITSLGTKYIRVHLFGAVFYRDLRRSWLPGDREALAAALARVLSFAPRALRPLSIRDRRLADAIADLSVPDREVGRLARSRRQFWTPGAVLTKDPMALLDRDAPPRFMAASLLVP